jgi:nucleoid DNA-binding protein/DNA-directed RNA polymerase subunit RPC12/RpoP
MEGLDSPKKRVYTKSRLIKELAFRSGISQNQARAALEAIIEIAYREAKANFFILPGLCKFDVVRRKARAVRNPVTGEALVLPERDALRVTLSKRAKETVVPRVAPMKAEEYAAMILVENDAAEQTEAAEAAAAVSETTAVSETAAVTETAAVAETTAAAVEAASEQPASENVEAEQQMTDVPPVQTPFSSSAEEPPTPAQEPAAEPVPAEEPAAPEEPPPTPVEETASEPVVAEEPAPAEASTAPEEPSLAPVEETASEPAPVEETVSEPVTAEEPAPAEEPASVEPTAAKEDEPAKEPAPEAFDAPADDGFIEAPQITGDKAISFFCSTCGQEVIAPEETIGYEAECPTCGAILVVPGKSAEGSTYALKGEAPKKEIISSSEVEDLNPQTLKNRTIRIDTMLFADQAETAAKRAEDARLSSMMKSSTMRIDLPDEF